MAKLLPGSIDLTVDYSAPDWSEQQAKALRAMKTISFPVADGSAVYQVVSEKPVVLRHVNIGDGYRIPAAYIRGLGVMDVQALLSAEDILYELFGGVG